MVKLTDKELSEYRKSERFLIQAIDRDMEEIMYFEQSDEVGDEGNLRVAEELLNQNSMALNELRAYIDLHS